MTRVADASAGALRSAVQRVAGYLDTQEWLPAQNRYKTDCAGEYARAPRRTQDADFEDYMAAAVPLHCMDGWAYLARALQAQVAGDSARGVHLAYYAELRGALSLLGARGIAVLNQEHAVLDRTQHLHKIENTGTHQFAWTALRDWAGTSDAAELLGRTIQYQGIALSDWLGASGLVGMGLALAQSWFREWGADLKVFKEDRNARNTFSYRPTALLSTGESDAAAVTSQLRGFWDSFQPVGGDPFREIDGALIRGALRQAAMARPQKRRSRLDTAVLDAVSALGLKDPTLASAREFLLADVTVPGVESWLLMRLRDSARGSSENVLPGMIARATLLLRLATGAAKELAVDGDWQHRFTFWVDRFASDTGLWSAQEPPDALGDLRADITSALLEAEEWLRDARAPVPKATWLRENASRLQTLSAAQLVGLWGLAG